MDAKIAEVRARKPVEDYVSILSEPIGAVPVTYRFHRGDPKQPKEAIPPGTFAVLGPSGQPTGSAFAAGNPRPPHAAGWRSQNG